MGLANEAGKRVGLILGGGVAGRAALVALQELGFGRVLHASAVTPQRELDGLQTYLVTLDKTAGGSLGLDISHDNGATIRVESVKGGLVAGWNVAHPDLEVCAGDYIVQVNGTRGEAALLLEQCSKDELLEVRLAR